MKFKSFYIVLLTAICLVGCASKSPRLMKQGVAIEFKRLDRGDPNYDMPTFQGTLKEALDATPTAGSGIGAAEAAGITGAVVMGSAIAINAPGAMVLTASAPAVIVVAAAAGVAAVAGAIADAVLPENDCGDGRAHFTFKTAEGDIKTIRTARALVCQHKPGDIITYAEDNSGIAVFPK